MTSTRQQRRRALKPKMADTRVVTQTGGRRVMFIRRAAYDREMRIRADPEFRRFSEVAGMLALRPPVFGCDPLDPLVIRTPCEMGRPCPYPFDCADCGDCREIYGEPAEVEK
jgi:hypothetical protein